MVFSSSFISLTAPTSSIGPSKRRSIPNGTNLIQSNNQEKGAVQHFRKRASSMTFSTPEGGSISTLINPTQGDEQFSVGELVIQEQEGSKVDEITDVVVTRKDELDDGHEEFVACDEEAAILRAALWDAKFKLTNYRASMRSTTVAASQNTMPT
ncbi:uncharacterized protein DS421_19g647820 [Arachis hypogaea]|uniref:Uncharacterized protein n=1 Tax=Arachis hypogaea TaxID=3818 RepID=A0A6B9V5N4_ARAHY|nr:uncharacterized protein DS421_19g647820 [Arachis hypogaea]